MVYRVEVAIYVDADSESGAAAVAMEQLRDPDVGLLLDVYEGDSTVGLDAFHTDELGG